MKKLITFFVAIFTIHLASAQNSLTDLTFLPHPTHLSTTVIDKKINTVPNNFKLDLTFLQQTDLIFVNTGDQFQTVYLIDQKGKVIDQGIANGSSFNMYQHRFNFAGDILHIKRDSFNPYGTNSLEGALILGTINSLLNIGRK